MKNQFWIVTNGKEKVGNVIANDSGYDVKLNGSKTHYKNTRSIEKITNIKFEAISKLTNKKADIPFKEYPTTSKVHNSILDIKRKLHLFTKTPKSKCFYAAGWYILQQGIEKKAVMCPKYIFIQRYPYEGPFKTKIEAESQINN